jgi:branched-chain amino acid transport system permease protein
MQYWFDVINRILLFGSLAISLNLLVGYAGYLSLAHAAFFGIGAYASGLMAIHAGASFLVATVVAVVVAGIGGALIAFPAIRISGEYVVLLTLAFLGVVNQLEIAWIPVTGGYTGLFPVPHPSILGYEPRSPGSYLPMMAVMTVIVLAVCLTVVRSPFGRVLKGLREDVRATRALGKNSTRFALVTFAVASGLAGLVGSVWAHYFSFITPDAFNLNQTIYIAAIVVLGGSGNLLGSILGAGALIMTTELLTDLKFSDSQAAAIQQVIFGTALVLFMRFRPDGILRENASLLAGVHALRRRLARRGGGAGGVGETVVAARPAAPPAKVVAHAVANGETPALRGVALRKQYAGIQALRGVDISLARGSLTTLVGPNGAGKTTLFNALTGDVRPDDGRVLLNGEDITGAAPDVTVRRGLARSFQDVRVFQRMTVQDNVAVAAQGQPGESLVRVFLTPWSAFAADRAVRRSSLDVLDTVGLRHRAGTMVSELAYGEQKLLALARLVATGSEVILLDEPSSGLDHDSVENMLAVVNGLCAEGRTVCVVEHNLDFVRRLSGEAFFLEAGEITARGTIEDLMGQERLVATYFGA